MLSENTKHLPSRVMLRNNWEKYELMELFARPFNDLLFQAQFSHRQYFDPNEIQLSTLVNIKEGGCPEDIH